MQADLNWLTDPTVFQVNRLEAHSDHVCYASEEELATLPGIGGVLAGRIVDYRTEHGPFEAEEDLLKVSGIGERKLAELDGRITAGG